MTGLMSVLPFKYEEVILGFTYYYITLYNITHLKNVDSPQTSPFKPQVGLYNSQLFLTVSERFERSPQRSPWLKI